MKILVINSGSSSIKYKLFDFPSEKPVDKGVIENIGESKSKIKDHTQGVSLIIKKILSLKEVSSLNDIKAIGHRVVHGGEKFKQPHLINSQVIKQIEKYGEFAPLHNPANLAGIKCCIKAFPTNLQVAVFDTAFYQAMPKSSYIYAIPYVYYTKYKIRKYGFHGTSHQFVADKAAEKLKKPLTNLKLVTAHLGNGCSITAIAKGNPVATSMGFTPLQGLMMGTRSGDIDAAVVLSIMAKEKLKLSEVDNILNKQSGFLGVSGLSNDFRVVKRAAKSGNQRAKLAIEIFMRRIKEYVGAYSFLLGGLDSLVFTGGIGENNPEIANDLQKYLRQVLPKAKVIIVPTDEELMIAKLTLQVGKKLKGLKA